MKPGPKPKEGVIRDKWGNILCPHGRLRHQCKECGGASICEHGRQRAQCKECGGASICEHGRLRHRCKECGGASICEHGRLRHRCKECGGASICEHGRLRHWCKECGTCGFFIRGGFSPEQIKEIGAIKVCQFPGCLVMSNGKCLNSDHFHDGNKINTENYRGEICAGHNRLMADIDEHPEWASKEIKEYMVRRPYSKRGLK